MVYSTSFIYLCILLLLMAVQGEVGVNEDEIPRLLVDFREQKEQEFEEGKYHELLNELESLEQYLEGTAAGMIPDVQTNILLMDGKVEVLRTVLGEKKFILDSVELSPDQVSQLKEACYYLLYGRFTKDIALQEFKKAIVTRVRSGDEYFAQVIIFVSSEKTSFTSFEGAEEHVVRWRHGEATITPELTYEEEILEMLMNELRSKEDR